MPAAAANAYKYSTCFSPISGWHFTRFVYSYCRLRLEFIFIAGGRDTHLPLARSPVTAGMSEARADGRPDCGLRDSELMTHP